MIQNYLLSSPRRPCAGRSLATFEHAKTVAKYPRLLLSCLRKHDDVRDLFR